MQHISLISLRTVDYPLLTVQILGVCCSLFLINSCFIMSSSESSGLEMNVNLGDKPVSANTKNPGRLKNEDVCARFQITDWQ